MRSHTLPFGSHYTHVVAHPGHTYTPQTWGVRAHTLRGADAHADLSNLKRGGASFSRPVFVKFEIAE